MEGSTSIEECDSFLKVFKACIRRPCGILGHVGKCLKRGYSRIRSLFDQVIQNSDRECLNGANIEETDPGRTNPTREEPEQDPDEENPNIRYVENGHRKQTLDLYLPRLSGRQSELTPVVIYIRYDSCMMDNSRALRDYVQNIGEYALAFVDYRDDDLPAAVYDCKAAIRWLRAHAAHYKLDPDCFIVWGKCDAGLLAAILGTTAHLRVFDVGDYLNTSSAVQGVMA
ncbi:hypothetical protein PV04_01227 [Phialophora macrospora]|uniref:BD-FAE-like domain-containing protein n=1 Tax=Phialophora macrospora TaxID=1851006 RepID=A0A0D2G2Q1_9EURO|nr:hypothetical protein PV04_01227 [Phialophora macrospora]